MAINTHAWERKGSIMSVIRQEMERRQNERTARLHFVACYKINAQAAPAPRGWRRLPRPRQGPPWQELARAVGRNKQRIAESS
eukprot:5213898-Pyramimonas_sp.AAC.1